MIRFVSIAAAATLLAACASQPETAANASAKPTIEGESSLAGGYQTGSRTSWRNTDRMIRAIGNQSFKQDDAANIRSLGNEVGARSN